MRGSSSHFWPWVSLRLPRRKLGANLALLVGCYLVASILALNIWHLGILAAEIAKSVALTLFPVAFTFALCSTVHGVVFDLLRPLSPLQLRQRQALGVRSSVRLEKRKSLILHLRSWGTKGHVHQRTAGDTEG